MSVISRRDYSNSLSFPLYLCYKKVSFFIIMLYKGGLYMSFVVCRFSYDVLFTSLEHIILIVVCRFCFNALSNGL